MRIALVGYGSMGREVERVALTRSHEIGPVFDEDAPLGAVSELQGADVLIDFSLAEAVVDVLETAARAGVPVVEGTTGWHDAMDQVQRIPALTMIHSPNFSVGVYQFMRIARQAGRLLGPLGYDCYVHESHHRGKADSPSGTARRLAGLLVEALPEKRRTLEGDCNRRIAPEELHVSSTRIGRVPGTHEVGFDSEADTIVLRHEAHSRAGFARGAVLAAEWIVGQTGIFSMDQFMNSLMGEQGDTR